MNANKALSASAYLCIALFLVISFSGLVSSSTRAQTLASDIIIEDADSIWTNIPITSADLIDVAENVTPRVVAEYANYIFKVGLYSSGDLNQAASAVLPRIIMEYGNSVFKEGLYSSEDLNQVASTVTPRIIVEHADSLFETSLHEMEPTLPVLSVSPTSLDFGVTQTQKTFNISNTGGGTLTWSISEDKTWLSVSPTSGTGAATITVNVDRSGLSPGDYAADISVSSNGGNETVHVTMEVEAPPENEPPTAYASDISGQPQTMYPDTIYSVTAKYYDPDGRDDLKHCYLQLRHPSKPLTMMWYQFNGSYSPWAGEEGANYLTITSVTSTELANGYELTWSFKINDNWPYAENFIDFGVSARDDDDLESGWDYDNTNASFVEAIVPVDLRVERIVPIQAIEGVPLVKDKATMVRCFVKLEGIEDLQVVEAQAEVDFGGDKRTVESWLVNFEGETYVFPSAEEANHFISKAEDDPKWFRRQIQYRGIDSINFDFPERLLTPAIEGSLRIHARVTLVRINDSDLSNNELEDSVIVKPMKRDLKILFQRIEPGSYSWITGDNEFKALADNHYRFLIATYPIAERHCEKIRRLDVNHYGYLPYKFLLARLNLSVIFSEWWRGVFVVPKAYLEAQGKYVSGTSHPLCKRAVLINEEAYDYRDWDTTAHEIGHTYDFEDVTWPPLVATDGWDVSHGTVNPNEGIDGPGKVHVSGVGLTEFFVDFMSNVVNPKWIFRGHYDVLMNGLVSGGSDPRLLVVSGLIYQDGSVELFPLYSLDGIPDELTPGSYAFETHSAEGAVLGRTTFEPTFDTADEPCPFAFSIPYPEGTQKVILKRNDVLLAEVVLTPNSPVVTVAPVLDLGGGKYGVQWEGTDADGDMLDYLVYYSHDGQDWLPLNPEGTSFELDTSLLPGGKTATIRVVASDGMNTTEGLSSPFTVPTKAPEAYILSPDDGSSFAQGAQILFRGGGYDAEDGELAGSSLVWISDVDGVLGQGNVLSVSNLSLGNHRIALTAADGEGKTATASIQTRIYTPGHKVYLPLIMKN